MSSGMFLEKEHWSRDIIQSGFLTQSKRLTNLLKIELVSYQINQFSFSKGGCTIKVSTMSEILPKLTTEDNGSSRSTETTASGSYDLTAMIELYGTPFDEIGNLMFCTKHVHFIQYLYLSV